MNSWASSTCVTDGEVVIAFFGRGGIHAYSVDGKHHYLPAGLVATVEGDTIRLSATGATAVDLFEEAE